MWQASAKRNPRTVERAINDILDRRLHAAREQLIEVVRQDVETLMRIDSRETLEEMSEVMKKNYKKIEDRMIQELIWQDSMDTLKQTGRAVRDRIMYLLRKALFLGPKD